LSLNFGFTNNNHSDWSSFGIQSTQPSGNILVKQCWAESHPGQPTAISNNGNGDTWLQCTNFTYENCVFIGFAFGVAPWGANGSRFQSCLIYQITTNAPSIVHGIDKSSINNDIRNNILFENYNLGTDSSRGWYNNGWVVGGADTNVIGFVADFNYVGGASFAAKDQAPPDDWAHWKVTGTEANGINGGDVKWANASIYDFRLMTNSPLLNAGTNVVATDYFGQPRLTAFVGPIPGTSFFAAAAEATAAVSSLGGAGTQLHGSGSLK
jgi:hypothetical protein